MNTQDRVKFVELMTGLGAVYDKAIAKPLLSAYWTALERFPIEDVKRAIDLHIADTEAGRFFPKPADLIRVLDGDAGSVALLAWSKVLRAVQAIGTYESVAFDDPIIHAVVEDMGGWLAMGAMDVDEQPFRAKEFEKRYQGYLRQQSVPAHTLRWLPGRVEHQHQLAGYDGSGPVRLIGDHAKARLVLGGETPLQLAASSAPAQIVDLRQANALTREG